MKFFVITIIALVVGLPPSLANESQPGFSTKQTCTRNEYREQYFPGTRDKPGYIRTWEETVQVPCGEKGSTIPISSDHNDCSEGKIAGGILGGGLATAISRGKDRWWAIPAGIVSGSVVGCQIDGG